MIELHLDVPPSVNNLYFNLKGRGGRARTPQYHAWLAKAGWQLKAARQQPIPGPVAITYRVVDAGRKDLANLEKPLTDLLVKHRLIEGDSRKIVRRFSMEWAPDVLGCHVTVEPCAQQ
jgi:Holliday junction resolvase RusA-like endonuclease